MSSSYRDNRSHNFAHTDVHRLLKERINRVSVLGGRDTGTVIVICEGESVDCQNKNGIYRRCTIARTLRSNKRQNDTDSDSLNRVMMDKRERYAIAQPWIYLA